ncbi:MAG: hypothetical protein LBI91_01075 [Spirochaetaceae bacterium]|jgi:hypothetical protein|nr:hypothetical protein [Spirochaetaceae bacterium]
MTQKSRRICIRAALVLLWIGLGILLFSVYRGHSLLIDNRNTDGGPRAPDLITVSVDGGKSLEYFRGDRDRFAVAGTRHRIRVEFSDGAPPFEQEFSLPIRDDMYLLSVPKMLNGLPFVEVFHTAPEPRVPEEEEIPSGDLPFGEIPVP